MILIVTRKNLFDDAHSVPSSLLVLRDLHGGAYRAASFVDTVLLYEDKQTYHVLKDRFARLGGQSPIEWVEPRGIPT